VLIRCCGREKGEREKRENRQFFHIVSYPCLLSFDSNVGTRLVLPVPL